MPHTHEASLSLQAHRPAGHQHADLRARSAARVPLSRLPPVAHDQQRAAGEGFDLIAIRERARTFAGRVCAADPHRAIRCAAHPHVSVVLQRESQ